MVPQPGEMCIQFLVTRKQSGIPDRARLPRFIYRRRRGGGIDRHHRVPTDVIAVGRIHASCGAGDSLRSNGDGGLITLIFRNKAEIHRPFYLLTCAHVAGGIQRSPPAYRELVSDDANAKPFAHTLVNSTADGEALSYDIALARIDEGALPLVELRVRGEKPRLKSILPARLVQPGTGVQVTRNNLTARGTVVTVHASATISYSSGSYDVHNLWGVNVTASPGDSGGLVYRGSEAIGLVVAASPEGWLWFQPLESAIAFLNTFSPVPVAVFNPSTNPP